MTHFPRSRLEIQDRMFGKNQSARYTSRLYRSRTDIRTAGTRSSPVKPNLGDEIFSIAHQWLINKTGPGEGDSKRQDIPTIEINPPSPSSREIKVYIPLEKTYRAELRQITERIGLKLDENECSRAARDFVTKNPIGTEDIITQEKERSQKAFVHAKKSTILPRPQTAFGSSFSTLNRRGSCFETGNRKLDYFQFGKKLGQPSASSRVADKLFLKVRPCDQASIGSQSSKYQAEKITFTDRSEKPPLQSSQTDGKLFASRNQGEGSGTERVDENSTKLTIDIPCPAARTLERRKAQRRTPNATSTIPPVTLEDSLKYLQKNTPVPNGTLDSPSNYRLLLNQERRQTMPNLEIRNSLDYNNRRYLALPSYDLRYHLEPEKPWIKDDVSGCGDESPESPRQNYNPSAECVRLSIRKVTEWLIRCPSPSTWSQCSQNVSGS